MRVIQSVDKEKAPHTMSPCSPRPRKRGSAPRPLCASKCVRLALQPITYNRSDDAVVAAVDGDLSAGGCAEGGAAEFDDDTGHDPARYLGAENVISFIGVDR